LPLRSIVNLELASLALLILCAALMAKGVGTFAWERASGPLRSR